MKYKFAFCFCLSFAVFCKLNAQEKKANSPIAVRSASKSLISVKNSAKTKSLVRIKVAPGSKFIIHNVQIKPGTYITSIPDNTTRSELKIVK